MGEGPAGSALQPDAEATLRGCTPLFGHVTTWVFDLDNTLYPRTSGIWDKIDERITLFVVELFGLDGQSARALHQYYYLRHGSTLRGSSKTTSMKPSDFSSSSTTSTVQRCNPIPRSQGRSRDFRGGN